MTNLETAALTLLGNLAIVGYFVWLYRRDIARDKPAQK
jgi:hypothetical protein